jgi:hypothetical protein
MLPVMKLKAPLLVNLDHLATELAASRRHGKPICDRSHSVASVITTLFVIVVSEVVQKFQGLLNLALDLSVDVVFIDPHELDHGLTS